MIRQQTRLFLPLALLLLPLLATSVADGDNDAEPAKARFSFTEVTGASGVSGSPNAGGHGVAFADVDNDGFLDIFVTNTPSVGFFRNYLYMNRSNGKFREEAEKRGVEGSDLGSHGVVFADLDNDGDLDLIVANSGLADGPGQNRVYLNDGRGYFKDTTRRARMLGKLYSTRAVAAGDFNGDGKVDFVITNPVADSATPPPAPLQIDRFFTNLRKARFRQISSGLAYTGHAQGLTVGDIDNDGDLDLIESKRSAINYDGITNSLWLNDGAGGFTEAGPSLGDKFYRDGSKAYNGSALGDADNDGDLDMLVVSENADLRFFRNDGDGSFTEITSESGLFGRGYTAAFGDLDNDGRLDIVVSDRTISEAFRVFRNLGGNRFTALSGIGAAPPTLNDPRGMALGDYDNDGDLDIVIVQKLSHIQLFRNNRNTRGFMKLRLTSPSGEAGAVGAKVWVFPAGKSGEFGELLAYREVGSSTGYISQNAPEVHVGLRRRKRKVDILVKFLDGSSVSLTRIRPGRTITLGFEEN